MAAGPARPVDRYGAPAPWVRPLTVGVVGLVAALGLGWLTWAALYYANPQVASQLVSYDVLGAHRVRVRIQIEYAADVTASCRVTAQSGDQGIVGDLTFEVPARRRDTVTVFRTIPTERAATNVVLEGCTPVDPARPR